MDCLRELGRQGGLSFRAYADGLVLLAKSEQKLLHMHRELCVSYALWGLGCQEEKLCLWNSSPGGSVSMALLGALLCGEPSCPPDHGPANIWNIIRTNMGHMITRARMEA